MATEIFDRRTPASAGPTRLVAVAAVVAGLVLAAAVAIAALTGSEGGAVTSPQVPGAAILPDAPGLTEIRREEIGAPNQQEPAFDAFRNHRRGEIGAE